MKTPKIGDTVTISKPGLFNGCTGKILSDTEGIKNRLSVMVNLTNGGILWNFSYADIEQDKKVAPQGLKSSETTQQINTDELTPAKIKAISKMGVKNVIASLEKESKQKRPYKRRDKTEIKATKPKRPYNKRK